MEKKKIIFLVRFVLFVIFACILPFSFIAWRFGLFSQSQGEKVALTGWGVIAIIIVMVFIIYTLRMLKQGQPYSMFTQICSGLIKVIMPLTICLLLLKAIRENIDSMIQALTWTIICEMFAIVINPLPKWVEENHIDKENLKADTLISKFGAWWKEKDKE